MAKRNPYHPAMLRAAAFEAEQAKGTTAIDEVLAPLPAVVTTAPPAAPAIELAGQDELAESRALIASLQAKVADNEALSQELETYRGRAAASDKLAADLDAVTARLAQAQATQEQQSIDDIIDGVQIEPDDEDEISPRALEAIKRKLLKPVIAHSQAKFKQDLDRSQAEITELRNQIATSTQDAAKAQRSQQLQSINARILTAHADFATLKTTKGWEARMATRIPGSRQTYGEALGAAYSEGDAEFIAEHISAFKKTLGADAALVADLPRTSGAAATTAAAASTVKFKYDDSRTKRLAFQRGEIDRKEYSEFLKQFQKAESEGRVS